jgi:hypothetical protein
MTSAIFMQPVAFRNSNCLLKNHDSNVNVVPGYNDANVIKEQGALGSGR